MLEGLVAWVINNYLGKYVENLNTHQLSIALLKGAVELENLPLRKDALRQVGLPIQVRAGLIGKVKLKIPVTQLTSAPWEIYMEQLYLIAGPLRLTELDEEAEEQAVQDYKLGQLDAIEARWRSENETSSDSSFYASSYSSWYGMSMNFAANIIENLQLKIKDVHLRYEDNVTVDGKVFATGIQIESLVAQSCDESWNPTFVSCSSKESFKLMEMQGFSVYCNEIESENMWGDLAPTELVAAMSGSFKREFILSPVHSHAHVKRNRSEKPLRSKNNPRIVCDLTLDQVPLSLSDRQYQLMVGCKHGLVNLARRHGHLRSRPKAPVSADPRAWWTYAIHRVVKPAPTWSSTLARARENLAYVTVYSKLLSNPTDPLSKDDKAVKDKVEWEREYDELKELREISMRRVRPPESGIKAEGSVGLLASWFPGWWQSSQKEPQEEKTDPDTVALEEKILDALADTVENNTILKRDTVFGQFNFTLKKGAINLCSESEALMELQFENVNLGFESRPRTGSHCFQVTLGALFLKDHLYKDSAFPVLIAPQKSESAPSGRPGRNLPPGLAKLATQGISGEKEQPLFQLCYEYKPFNTNVDRKLEVHSKSLDIVYNPGATKWILEFFTSPHQAMDSGLRQAARQGYNAVKKKTKQQLLSNWESIVHGHAANRKMWDVELDISAPQIFLVEHFNDKNTILCVVDFGKLHFTNRIPGLINIASPSSTEAEEEEDEEAFQTPCSTPPGSEVSSLTCSRNPSVDNSNINELQFHDKLYDKYTIDLCDLQILVGCVRDNWKFAHLRGTSTLHILDKFNISLLMERRVVHTIDPQYPSLTLTGNLPKLVAHVNEDKVKAVQTLINVISGKGLISPLRSQEGTPSDDSPVADMDDTSTFPDDEKDTTAKLLMLQFSIDQMALEVQSRGRSVAELQVNGVKASFQKRPYDTSLSLSVHGLLLVDALQTFGPDFELLIASHKHVGMDTVKGSLQDSEPTSPVSPASPEPEPYGKPKLPTSPMAISKALSSISDRAKSPVGRIPSPPQIKIPPFVCTEFSDVEALISVELTFVNADCPTNDVKEHLQIANIQFNNLDIIANQETIVELVGFVHRVFPKQKSSTHFTTPQMQADTVDHGEMNGIHRQYSEPNVVTTRTQLTFDFHRLNVLLLRAVLKDGGLVGRKIATATMTEAKIHASVGTSLEVEGSLGGLQVLDLTPEGHTHQRILSLGEDPLTEKTKDAITLAHMAAEMYNMSGGLSSHTVYNNQAFSFSVKRTTVTHDTDVAEIMIRMASVWYIHSPHILYELKSCAVEFKQYLSNLFMSIKSAATEVAMGIVQCRAESLAQSLSMSMGGRLYGSSGDVSQTPRKRRSLSYSSTDHLESSRGSVTPHSPAETACNTIIKWDVVLASPVVVVPRSTSSPQVVVAYLGSISVTNSGSSPISSPWGISPYNSQKYNVCITSMNLYTLDISKRIRSTLNLSESSLMRAEELYCSRNDGIPVLHNTSIQLTVVRELSHIRMKQNDDILLESGADFLQIDHQEALQVQGSTVNALKLSLTREQYEQLLETVDRILTPIKGESEERDPKGLSNIEEEPDINTGVSTLSMDSALRARMMAHSAHKIPPLPSPQSISITVGFELPLLSLELIADLGSGQQKLVDLSFKELIVQFEKSHSLETSIQISLNSVAMEDLQKPADSRHRFIMVSSHPLGGDINCYQNYISKSCPNLSSPQGSMHLWHSSLPDHLETGEVLGAISTRHRHIVAAENSIENRMKGTQPKCPYTPPPSPRGKMSPNVFREDNLVHVNIVLKPSRHSKMIQSRQVTVDFNSLDVIVNVESWVVVLDFFGISDIDEKTHVKNQQQEPPHTPSSVKSFPGQLGFDSELEITVKSLSLVLNRAEYEVARAVMTNLSSRLVSMAGSDLTQTEASVGSFTLFDLTPHHSNLYREKFITAGLKLSMSKYNSPDILKIRPYDIQMKLDMVSLVYVHTQRYVSEIQAFFNLFPHLRREVGYFRGNVLEDDVNAISTRVLMEIHAPSPIIILPMSSQSSCALVADLGNLSICNSLKMSGSEGIISKSSNSSKETLLDVMNIMLESMDIVTGERVCEVANASDVPVGGYAMRRKGSSLLKEKCHLKLQVERNLMKFVHTVPDLTIHGNLSTLAARLTLSDYQLISGLLSFNIGECLDDLQLPEISPVIVKEDDYDHVWTCTSMKFELVDVSVALVPNSLCDLACINFIKSSLTVDNYSNRTQDIDLVSQEILITDIRFLDKPANKRSNVFTNILQPIQSFNESETVQAQIHHRKYVDSSKFTILLNNMRLMAIVDWWEAVRDFIMTKPDSVHAVSVPRSTSLQNDAASPRVENPETPYELKLNITDSEIVVVEDSSQWDTNAVILKSTTVITYRPTEIMKPVSCNLNHCEMFSCILGMEDETALSIIDPVTVNMEIIRKQDTDGLFQKVLRVHMAHLSLRLSYHDVRMFHQMLQSLPQQTQYARSQVAAQHPANFRYQLDKLRALGFRLEDCSEALCKCNGQLDDAALWLTQNAIPISSYQGSPSSSPHHSHLGDSMLSFSIAEVETDSVCLCIIDDCQDADVPLLEFSLTKLEMKQDLDKRSGIAAATLSIHYYNRLLSGWEPFVEPWSCNLCWDCLSQTLTKTRIELTVASSETLNMNITSTLVELYNSVKEIWTQDYYSQKESLTRLENVEMKNNLSSPPGYRRRSPFVPFAIKNDTGSRLFFSTITSGEESVIGHKPFRTSEDILNWTVVEPNGTVPFSFTERGRGRHRDTHKFRSHQVRVKVEGWMSTSPVTVDRVGVFFREAFPDIQFSTQDMPLARIVLEVTLEGSARKLITVRSALQIYNKLDHMVEVKLNNAHLQKSSPVHLTVTAGDVLSVPLTHAMAVLYARPLDPNQYYSFSTRPITWKLVNSPEQMAFETRQCNTNANIPFRFCVAIKRENYPIEKSPPLAPGLAEIWTQPAHVLTLLPPLTIVNLLPYELYYTIRGSPIKGKKIVKPGQKHSSCEVDLEKYLELIFNLENFPSGGSLQIPEFTNGFTTRVRLQDQTGRRLHLQAQIYSNPGASIKVVISAPYWLVNKTALPIVFKQEGVTAETAGQYEEHEVARMVAPLLFSFSDIDASPTVIARVGNGVHPEGFPQWCRHFTLQPGVQVRRLKVSLRENRPDLVYMIGIEIRQGKGRYRPTKIVTLSAHYQIHNKSSYKLQFAQRCFASTVSDPGAEATYLTAVPNCYLPFHWPRLDKDQLLCLRILDVPQCLWSGGFKIDSNTSFHLNIRDQSGRMYFLRIEIVLQGATFFIVLTDADTMPPPIRIDNFSKVPITIHQAGLSNCVSTVKAGNSTPYAWDEPIRAQILTVTAPGGVSAEYNLNRLGDGPGLTYENFIYIAFTATFKNSKGDKVDVLDVENQQLVLDVPDPTTGRVVLSQKQAGARSQLWRMTADGHLQHEGSSPPRALSDKVMVLDIYGPAPQPTQYVGLVIRRPDRRRVSTQSWKFTEDGRLCCAHSSMCVQAKDGFFGLHKGSEVVLGPPQAVTYQTTDTGIPLEQAVSRQRLRPGSGFLSVCVSTDGPTRVLQITDIKEKRVFTFADEGAWINVTDSSNSARRDEVQNKEMQITMSIPVVGISLISRNPPEELVYIYLSTVKLEVLMQNRSELLDLSIQDIQIDNQVFEAQCPVTLYVSPISRSSDPEEGVRPAVSISAEKTLNKYSYNADIFKHLFIRVKNMSLIIDERLLLKLFQFIGWNSVESNESADESDFETQRILAEASSVHAKRYYFGALKILFTQVRLSFITCSKLDPELQAIKRKLGLTLIKFEDANVELQPFSRQHSFENNQILFNSIIKHYKDELKWQAGIILGSVDFLGNPIGFVNDLSEGVSGLIYEGNVGALVKNVAHGLSNSAAKVTETLGDGIGLVILDDRHEEMRQRIRSVKSGSSGEHLVAGLKGLGFGLLGGVTSLVKQTYDGAASDGFQGLIAGLGKGLVGTVTKPVVGVLDLASETATAVRDSSRSSSKQIPPKKRAPRCVTSPAGFLPPYNKKQSQGQQYLYSINHRNYKELFMAYEVLRSGMEDLRIVISSETVRVFSCTNSSNGTSIVFERQLGDLEECKPITVAGISTDPPIFYIELKMRDPIGSIIVTQEGKRPRVRCDSEGIATWVSQQINYAKERYIERQNTLVSNCSGQSIFDD